MNSHHKIPDGTSGRILLTMTRLVATVVILLTIAWHPALAQQPSGQPLPPPIALPSIQVLATPYLWLPWTSVGARPADTRLSSKSTTIDPVQLVSHLTWVPFMGEAEFRAGPYGLLVDYLHAPLKAGVSTRNILFNGANAGVTIDTGTAMFFYRAIASPDQHLDVGAGVRAWGLDGSIALDQGLLPSVSVADGLSWADPMIAARFHQELGNGFGATAYGDVGGFGVGAHIDWQVLGTIDYTLKPGIDLHAGFRSLNFNYGAPRAGISVNMNGPIVAATFRF